MSDDHGFVAEPSPEERYTPELLDALDKVLQSTGWRDYGGLSADNMYGQLACDVAKVAIAAEREACAKILDYLAREAQIARDNYRALGNAELDAQRHDARASAYTFGADAIRARGE